MKTRLLAFLLCLVLVASALLMTACGGSKNSDPADETNAATSPAVDKGTSAATGKGTVASADDGASTSAATDASTPAATDAATAASTEPSGEEEMTVEEQTALLASFMKGMLELRKKGVQANGFMIGSKTDAEETDTFSFALSADVTDYMFRLLAEGTVNSNSGTAEIYFDGSVLGMYSDSADNDPDYEILFLEDLFEDAPVKIPALIGGIDGSDELEALYDQILALIDLDKVAAKIGPLTAGVITIEKDGENYKVTITSDALFNEAIRILTVLKNSGDLTIAELIDALLGEGTFANLKATLEKYHGTDKLADLLPDLEAILSDCGLKVDAAYAFAADLFNQMGEGEEPMTGEDIRNMLIAELGELTVNDAIALISDSDLFSFGNTTAEVSVQYSGVEPLERVRDDLLVDEGLNSDDEHFYMGGFQGNECDEDLFDDWRDDGLGDDGWDDGGWSDDGWSDDWSDDGLGDDGLGDDGWSDDWSDGDWSDDGLGYDDWSDDGLGDDGLGDDDWGDDDLDDEEEEIMTYEEIVALFFQFADMKVNDLIASFMMNGEEEEAPEVDLAAVFDPVIGVVESLKEAIIFRADITCDSKMIPTAFSVAFGIDTTKLPAEMEADPVTLAISVSAEIKDSVTVAPSDELQALIDKAARERESAVEE